MTAKRKAAGKARPKAQPARAMRMKRAMSVGASADYGVKDRVKALREAPLAVCESDKNLQAVLDLLRDRASPIQVRLAALQSLQAASFSVVAFESCRNDYIAALLDVVKDPQTDQELLQRVLGLLAREKNGYVQKRLLEGLKDPAKALVPPEKALQLLGYDVHAEAYAVARDIVKNPPNPTARREALRLLAADAGSADLFEKVLRDKAENGDARQIAASALQALRPERLQALARDLVLDPSEHEDIQAASLTALTNFGDQAAVAQDDALLKQADRLGSKGSTKVKASARRLLGKHGR